MAAEGFAGAEAVDGLAEEDGDAEGVLAGDILHPYEGGALIVRVGLLGLGGGVDAAREADGDDGAGGVDDADSRVAPIPEHPARKAAALLGPAGREVAPEEAANVEEAGRVHRQDVKKGGSMKAERTMARTLIFLASR